LKLSYEREIESSVPQSYAAMAEGWAKARPLRPAAFLPDRADAVLSSGFARGGLAPRVLRRLHDHIDANIDQRISVEALARLANLSVCYFVRAFKQSVGVTPHDYLIRRRVERAMELLSDTDLSLSEIALAAGFADQSHCARRVRQHVRMSPRDYCWSVP